MCLRFDDLHPPITEIDSLRNKLKKIIGEINDKMEFAKQRRDADDELNAGYWAAFVHGLKYAKSLIELNMPREV